MPATYKIHPGIGIARLGNSPDEFCISPETPAALPTACDEQGNPLLSPDGKSTLTIEKFKDAAGRIKRQAARFQIYVYDDEHPDGRPLTLGDPIEGGGNNGILVNIQWRVYVANKKAAWYEFEQLEGEHGYSSSHTRRNASITDSGARQRLIIDPGPQLVDCKERRNASFSREGNDLYAPTFPPPLQPNAIDTLGELKTDETGRLLVLGGYGNAGSYQYDDFGQPRIDGYANNDGWFDDVSDGPVMARLTMYSSEVGQLRSIDVEYPAWVIVGYPSYAPEILDMVTMEEVIDDMAIRQFATRPDLYGAIGTFDDPQRIAPTDTEALIHWRAGSLEWNAAYKPWFYRDVWPILFRPDEFTYLTNILAQSNFPHNQSSRGNFDVDRLSVPPVLNTRALAACEQECRNKNQSGQLLLDTLDPDLSVLDSQANGSLRSNLDSFDQTIRGMLTDYQLRGEPIPGEQAYIDWLASLRQAYPAFLGDVLFGEFKSRVKDTLGGFVQQVTGVAGVASVDALEQEQELDRYIQQWRTMHATESDTYTAAKTTLEGAISKIIQDLSQKAIQRWNADVARADALFTDWGAAFSQQQDALRKQVADTVQHYVFERLQNVTLRNLKEYRTDRLLRNCQRQCIEKSTYDPHRRIRQYLFQLLREPGEENHFRLSGKPNNRIQNLPLMPLLAGDNPISNTLPSKFLRLTDTQLFILRQWANGLFYNEEEEGWAQPDPYNPYAGWVNTTGRDLDRGVMTNALGGAFCPGGEVGWVMRNSSIYREPYRIKADPDFSTFRKTAAQDSARSSVPDEDYVSYVGITLSQDNNFDRGLQPGDLTKYMALPWQADFNECSTQDINITYEEWNAIYPDSDTDSTLKREAQVWETLWWPAHRPDQTWEVVSFSNGSPAYQMLGWSRGIPGTSAGDLKMVTAWPKLGFVKRNPFESAADLDQPSPDYKYISVERNDKEGI